jgi:hypothetical protein
MSLRNPSASAFLEAETVSAFMSTYSTLELSKPLRSLGPCRMHSCKVEQVRVVNAVHLREHFLDFKFRRNTQSLFWRLWNWSSVQINITDYLDEFQDSEG